MSDQSGVRFARIHGRIVPLKGKGSAPNGVSKRYGAKRDLPKPTSPGIANGALFGATTALQVNLGLDALEGVNRGLRAHKMGMTAKGAVKHGLKTILKAPLFNFKLLALGTGVGAVLGAATYARRGKGESNSQLASRMAKKRNGTGA